MSLIRVFTSVALFACCVAIASSQPPPPGGGELPGGPTGTATIGGVGDPPSKTNPGAATEVKDFSASPAGDKGKLGGDVEGTGTTFKSGDTTFTVLRVYDKDNKLIVEKTAGDFTVP